mmetsp:Transcript_47145/g.54617  ORF Transcript_47145/g.54617 Transcript_47145/m.54617 type:complete len:221 (+) Transcript_47145:29-691(+)|eukprot:CAMPEP_0176428550 /NCGR_PEP_ID=MMETSP0127-20121128/13213_1 /TAXON_ID=938130 /ORGANISM="Platyophrya macrostoma, Strain WH" /LENGTH=220 /DNA_ID=CAMNT_0017810247 /DNA_START=22 /DNA_END=684 /DNA_ORIENTATION=+
MAESSKLVIAYWPMQGSAHPARLLLAYHKIDFEDKYYSDKKDWFENDKKTLKMDLPNVPYLRDGDFILTESSAMLHYAAVKTGNKELLGKTDVDAAKITQLYGFSGDIQAALLGLVVDKEYEKNRDTYLAEKIAPFLDKLSKYLGEKEFPIGYLTWADFKVFFILDVLQRMNPEFLAKWPNLEKYHERINNDNIKTYRKSENYPRFLSNSPAVTYTGEEK